MNGALVLYIAYEFTAMRLIHREPSRIFILCLTPSIRNMKGSVWSALPPINILSSESSKRIILAVASMDSASFFRDKNLGADSPISVSSNVYSQICFIVESNLFECCFYYLD